MSALKPKDVKFLVAHCSDSPQGRGDNSRMAPGAWALLEVVGQPPPMIDTGAIADHL